MTVYEVLKDVLTNRISREELTEIHNDLNPTNGIYMMKNFDKFFDGYTKKEIAWYFLNIDFDNFSFDDEYWKENEIDEVYTFSGDDRLLELIDINSLIDDIWDCKESCGVYAIKDVLATYKGLSLYDEIEQKEDDEEEVKVGFKEYLKDTFYRMVYAIDDMHLAYLWNKMCVCENEIDKIVFDVKNEDEMDRIEIPVLAVWMKNHFNELTSTEIGDISPNDIP